MVIISGVALGIQVNQLDELEVAEVIEFRKEAVNLCKEIAIMREASFENHSMYAYCAQLGKSSSHGLYDDLFPGGLIMLKVWLSTTHKVTVKVHREANADTVVRETLDSSSKRRAIHENVRQCSDFVLKICGRQEYLLGCFPITQYKVRLLPDNFLIAL